MGNRLLLVVPGSFRQATSGVFFFFFLVPLQQKADNIPPVHHLSAT